MEMVFRLASPISSGTRRALPANNDPGRAKCIFDEECERKYEEVEF